MFNTGHHGEWVILISSFVKVIDGLFEVLIASAGDTLTNV
jgi:hypothetical protein